MKRRTPSALRTFTEWSVALTTVPSLTLVTVTGQTVVLVVTVAVPFIPGFSCFTDKLFAVDSEAEIIRYRVLLRAVLVADGQVVAVDGNHLELAHFSFRRRLRLRRPSD